MGKKRNSIIILTAIAVAIVILGLVYFSKNNEDLNEIIYSIGGDRDRYGCLGAAGYAYDKDVGACIRAFELTPDIMLAVKIAVDYVGRGYALTVVSFNSYEEIGAYDIMFERGIEREKQTVNIKNWQVKK